MKTIHPTASVHPTAILPDDCEIGKYCVIGSGVKILTPLARIKDFTRIHDNTLVSGNRKFAIGYNCWVGNGCVLDTRGGLYMKNNIGIGAYSQLWSHIRFGDIVQGCLWNKEKLMIIGNDVWFVGHCCVNPIIASDWAMAMLGSVVTKDMIDNHIYAGTPAIDVTDKLSYQRYPMLETSVKQERLYELFDRFKFAHPREAAYVDLQVIDVNARTYATASNDIERDCLDKFLSFIYPLAKFFPIGVDQDAFAD